MDRVRATYVSQSFFETSARWTLLSLCLLGDPAMPYRAEESPVSTEQSTLGGLKARFRR